MKDAYYFSHDSNARHDPKILALRSIYGCEGYGWFWIIIEILREDAEFRFPLNKFQLMALSKELETNIDMLQKFLNDCFEIGLFMLEGSTKEGYLTCPSLDRRMAKYIETKEVRSIAGKKGAEARWQTHSKRIAKNSKVKESKVKEKKINNIYRAFSKPSYNELNAFIKDNNLKVDPNVFLDYYNSNGWKVGKSAMKDWKATARNWHRRNGSTHASDKKPEQPVQRYPGSDETDQYLKTLK